jgi:serine/threonine protein kinase/roadblock/LC7 domain-containing protein
MSLAHGARVGPYEITGWLGAGGMGEVYRARDPRLDRDVAIKLISGAFATDPRRVRRFEQEARAAGQLNHPNVLAVYDVGIHDGAPFIVSELLEGRTLREILSGGALPWRTAVDYARQIAEGLSAAHDKRILHRDVKPDNVFITHDKRIKILDFGIAKLTGEIEEESPRNITETAVGVALGTAAYMSPEQVRGENLDGRSDLFSLGSILYEMLDGRPAFARETRAETMTAVLKEHPDLGTSVSPALARLVLRCLEKSPEARFQSARDLAFGLDVLSDSSAPAAAHAQSSRIGLGSRRAWMIAALALAVLTGLAALMTRTEPIDDNPLSSARFTALTDWEGTESLAEISPDGRFVAFLADRDGQFDIWLTQVGTGEFRNLTTDIPPMNPPGVVLRNFGFTADGGSIWFSASGQPGDRKMLMPLLGGTSRPFLGEGDVTPSWSSDGRHLVFFNNKEGGGDPVFLADGSGGDARPLVAPEKGVLHNHNPIWSTDGTWIYFVRGVQPTSQMDVWRVRAQGGSPERLTTQRAAINFLAALDPHRLLYVARAEDRSGPWLWILDADTRVTRRVSSGLEEYTSLSASRDGRRLVATIARPSSTLWSVSIDAQAGDDSVERYPITTPRAMAPRVAREALFYLSARGADVGLWRFQKGRASEIWKGGERTLTEPPAVSPDGSMLALGIRQDGKRHLSVMSADGTNVRTIAGSIEIEGAPAAGAVDWSPDGRWLVAGGRDAQGQGLYKIPLDGQPPIKLVDGAAANPIWSPDGRLIVYAGPFVDGQVPLRGVRPDGKSVPLPPVRVREGGYRFLPDSSGIVFLSQIRSFNFSLIDLATGRQRQLTRLGDHGRLQTFDITPDGKRIVFDRLQENSDLVLIDRPR